jgi:integrase
MRIAPASGPWCIVLFLEMAVGLGARRGKVLALCSSDILEGRALITRSLTHTKHVLEFRGTKTDESRMVKMPEETLPKLAAHRKRQDEFRLQFGPECRDDPDLIFSNPDGSRLKPNSISATVSALFERLKIPKPTG